MKKFIMAAGTLMTALNAAFAEAIPYAGQTENGYYTISTADQLVSLANHVTSDGFSWSTFTLLNDIDMSGRTWDRPIGVVKDFDGSWRDPIPFKGKFDGCGYAIRNLNVSCTKKSGWGLFGNVQNATIRNLAVEGVVGGSSCCTAGLLVGNVGENTTISNCAVRADVTGRPNSYGTNIGAMIGCVSGANCVIADCTVSGTVGGFEGGGLVGRVTAASVFQRCQADTHVTTTNGAAAFVTIAKSSARFEDCHANGTADSPSAGAGGFVQNASLSACFIDCEASGEVTAYTCGGGFVGESSLCVYSNCVAKGNVTVTSGNKAGGFAAALSANGGEFLRCSAEGNVKCESSSQGSVGGFLGYGWNYGGTFRQCRASGNCEGGQQVGGFFGCMRIASTNDQCFALGDVVSRGQRAGGFVGFASKLYSFNSYSSGHVTGTTEVGGFVGYAENGCFSNCYAVGRYDCADPDKYGRYDGFLGHTSYTVPMSNCFALENRLAWSGVSDLTDAEFLIPNYFHMWPTDIWWLPSSDGVSRPQLAWSYQDEGTVVPSCITGSYDLAIPNAWFASYPTFEERFGNDKAAATVKSTNKKSADGSAMSVWQDYVTGNDPTDSNSVFAVSIAVTNGAPYVAWTPYLNSSDTSRIYRVLGKNDLSDETEEWLAASSTNRFFKVSVKMPNGVETSDSPGLIRSEL